MFCVRQQTGQILEMVLVSTLIVRNPPAQLDCLVVDISRMKCDD